MESVSATNWRTGIPRIAVADLRVDPFRAMSSPALGLSALALTAAREGGPGPVMQPILGLLLVMAAVFTGGCLLIRMAGRRAEAVTGGLGFLFRLCVLLNAVVLLALFRGARSSGTAPSACRRPGRAKRQILPRGGSCPLRPRSPH
ncbi:MAG: hypothetical protein INR70_19300 [Parafilimonas terrae]|nr:hypothetical protein [Parafilimonas terrae]